MTEAVHEKAKHLAATDISQALPGGCEVGEGAGGGSGRGRIHHVLSSTATQNRTEALNFSEGAAAVRHQIQERNLTDFVTTSDSHVFDLPQQEQATMKLVIGLYSR